MGLLFTPSSGVLLWSQVTGSQALKARCCSDPGHIASPPPSPTLIPHPCSYASIFPCVKSKSGRPSLGGGERQTTHVTRGVSRQRESQVNVGCAVVYSLPLGKMALQS